MNSAKTYWFPFSPPFRWPLRILGILALLGFVAHPSSALTFGLIQGVAFTWLSFLQPKLRMFTPRDILLRKIISVILVVLIGIVIATIAFSLIAKG